MDTLNFSYGPLKQIFNRHDKKWTISIALSQLWTWIHIWKSRFIYWTFRLLKLHVKWTNMCLTIEQIWTILKYFLSMSRWGIVPIFRFTLECNNTLEMHGLGRIFYFLPYFFFSTLDLSTCNLSGLKMMMLPLDYFIIGFIGLIWCDSSHLQGAFHCLFE